MLKRIVASWLAEPSTRGLVLDDPELTLRRYQLVRNKPSLRYSYGRWYQQLAEIDRLAPAGMKIELGSGGGFLREYIPGLVTTDLLPLPFVDVICKAESLPFPDQSAGAIYMVNVLHHLASVRDFFDQARRILRPGGLLAMVEPFNSPFSRLNHHCMHHEVFDPGQREWEMPVTGPLSGGNGALPWIIFMRDREVFSRQFPDLEFVNLTPHTPLVHILSGGVSCRSMVPARMLHPVGWLEDHMGVGLLNQLSLFCTILVRKRLT